MRKCCTLQYITVAMSMGKTRLNLALNYMYHPGIRITGFLITGFRITGVRFTERPQYLRTTKWNNQCEIYTQYAAPYKCTIHNPKATGGTEPSEGADDCVTSPTTAQASLYFAPGRPYVRLCNSATVSQAICICSRCVTDHISCLLSTSHQQGSNAYSITFYSQL